MLRSSSEEITNCLRDSLSIRIRRVEENGKPVVAMPRVILVVQCRYAEENNTLRPN